MKTIALEGKNAHGRVALVSDEDYPLVSTYKWYVREVRRPNGNVSGPYAMTTIWESGKQLNIFMHKMITGWPNTDHANRDGLDNQRHNLRPGANGPNQQNMASRLNSSSQYKGVTWDKSRGKWLASIVVSYERTYLGRFDDEAEAARAYDATALLCWGEYARLNFPGEHPEAIRQHWEIEPVHAPRVILTQGEKDRARVLSKFTRGADDECWLWTDKPDAKGYGVIKIGGKVKKAHRVVYEMMVGPIPDGWTIDHNWDAGCKHRHCVNWVRHLRPLPNIDNVMLANGICAIRARGGERILRPGE